MPYYEGQYFVDKPGTAARPDIDSYQVYKIIVKERNRFKEQYWDYELLRILVN